MAKPLSLLLKDEVAPKYHENMPQSQHGCVAGKSTDLANHLIRGMIEYAKLANLCICVIFLDLVKAFDRVVREYVLGMPQNCNISPKEYLCQIGLGGAALEHAVQYMESHPCLFQQWKIDVRVIEIINSIHSNAYYTFDDLESAILAPRGGRQGCTFGAIIFNSVYAIALSCATS